MNPYTNDSKFELNKMDAKLFSRVDKLKQNELTDVFYEEANGGEKMYKIIKVSQRTDAHQADLVKDYVKIQELAMKK
ncbi:hypothetical protein, partial [Saccharophagus degradans]